MTPSDPTVHRYLAGLPEPELPDTVWPRVSRAWRAKQRKQGSFWLALAASAGGLGLILAIQGSPPVVLEPGNPLVDQMDSGVHSQVEALDRAILAGYARGAGSVELAPLWRARQSLASNGQLTLSDRPVRL